MKKVESEDVVVYGCTITAVGLIIFGCWLAYKIAVGSYHLLDKI